MNNFANLGKAIILQSIGLQKNYTEIVESTQECIDYNNPHCNNCKYFALLNSFAPDSEIYKSSAQACSNCQKKIITPKPVYKKIYHNERNRYGYKPMLKSNAIKLLLLLHFQHPDRFGIIKNVNAQTLGTILNCNIKTIYNNLDILSNYKYISFSKIDTNSFTICLNDYESYYLPANKGGRGFIVMSKELLYNIMKTNNLISLRIQLRELIELDNISTSTPFYAINKTLREIKATLPNYCKPSIIKQSILKSSPVFDITISDSSIRFEIDEKFNSKIQKQNCYNEYYSMFYDFMKDFNQIVPLVNTNQLFDNKYNEFFTASDITETNLFHLLVFTEHETADLANLALQYSYNHVIDALSIIYKTYIMRERKIINLGGLLQTIISSTEFAANKAA